jgi:hypothetical protein|tara:strand:- start:445 stop:552 length:108 start_codon:yes stop_codon:yes gene_type:complete
VLKQQQQQQQNKPACAFAKQAERVETMIDAELNRD